MPALPSDLSSQISRQIVQGHLSNFAWRRLASALALEQQRRNPVFRRWLRGIPAHQIRHLDFPGLPIRAFKESIVSNLSASQRKILFESSGTTSSGREIVSRHFLKNSILYRKSVISGWKLFCRKLSGKSMNFAAILPSFLENPRSSLSCMLNILMQEFGDGCEFWAMKDGHWDWAGLTRHLRRLERDGRPVILFGTAFGWIHFLDWCARRHHRFRMAPSSTVFETGGFKGRSRALTREALHQKLARLTHLPLQAICSEYSMCELSSQAWSVRESERILFHFPPWCRIRIVRPKSGALCARGETGVLEIFDLANIDSCAFLRTEDLAIRHKAGFELLGRLPQADLKGCSLDFE